MDIGYKYCFITNIMLISLFYLPIFPLGMILGIGALLLVMIAEYFFIGYYKRPDVINTDLAKFFICNMKWALFIFAIGDYVFVGTLYRKLLTGWPLIFLIVMFVLCIIPYQSLKFNVLGLEEGDTNTSTYQDNQIYFSYDYEKLNPLTRRQAYLDYFSLLGNSGIIEQVECAKIIEFIKNQNTLSSYMRLKRNMANYIESFRENRLYMLKRIKNKMQTVLKTREAFDKNEKEKLSVEKLPIQHSCKLLS